MCVKTHAIGEWLSYEPPAPSGRNVRKTWYLYGLADPIDGVIRYIGSAIDPQKRLSEHVHGDQGTGQRLRDWVTGILEAGRVPSMQILDTFDATQSEALDREFVLIRSGEYLSLLNGYNPATGKPGRKRGPQLPVFRGAA